MDKIKVIIADPFTISREGIKSILSKSKNVEIIGEVKESKRLRDEINKNKVDIVIIDFYNLDTFNMDDIIYLKKKHPSISVLVISSNQSTKDVLFALDQNVRGYLLKETEEEEIFIAINALFKKENYFCSKVIDIILKKHLNKNDDNIIKSILSHRENEIVQLFTEGFTAKEIASKLFLSYHTINTHRKNILKKLKVNSTTELVRYAFQFGIVSSNKEDIP